MHDVIHDISPFLPVELFTFDGSKLKSLESNLFQNLETFVIHHLFESALTESGNMIIQQYNSTTIQQNISPLLSNYRGQIIMKRLEFTVFLT